jgi:hypothetical protein
LAVVTLGERFQFHILRASRRLRLFILFEGMENTVSFISKLESEGVTLSNVEFSHTSGKYVGINIDLDLKKKKPHDEIITYVKSHDGVAFVEEV